MLPFSRCLSVLCAGPHNHVSQLGICPFQRGKAVFTTRDEFEAGCAEAITFLESHYQAFEISKPLANKTGHTAPADTKSSSQILVSLLTGLLGLKRKKGADLDDGSDVKAASVWDAVDTPRFNGCLPAGRKSEKAKKANDVSALDGTPFLFFVLWDHKPQVNLPRCRIWIARPQSDKAFRAMAEKWYELRTQGRIKSDNFQLHPPRDLDSNVIRNNCGTLQYPLFFSAVRETQGWRVETLDPAVLSSGECLPAL